jgi:hypothetical protein
MIPMDQGKYDFVDIMEILWIVGELSCSLGQEKDH